MKRILLLALSATAVVAAPVSAAEDLGRLFFTPQQRQELDRRRAANAQEALVIQESSVTLRGHVSRSSGKSTTWINDVPHNDAYPTPDPSRVTLPDGEGEPPVSLKVGQTRDKARGETRDGLGGGKVEVLGGQSRNRKP
jgi:hypothetical protein